MQKETLEQNQIPIYFLAVIAAAMGGLLACSITEPERLGYTVYRSVDVRNVFTNSVPGIAQRAG